MSEARQSDEGLAAMMAELGVKARRAGRQLAIAPTDASGAWKDFP